MLLEFRVKNFKSIKDEVVLSTTLLKDKSKANLIKTNNKIYPNVLKSLMITGPNASGKSNVLEALYFMCYFIVTNLDYKPGELIKPVVPFKLDDNTNNSSSEFEISLLIDDVIYTYGFFLDNKEIYEEYLYSQNLGKRINIFKREKGKPFCPLKDEFEKEQFELFNRTDNNKLYLSVSASWKFKVTNKIYKFIKDKFNFINNIRTSNVNLYKKIQDDSNFKSLLINSLKDVDFAIKDLKISTKKMKEIEDRKKVFDFIEFSEGKEKAEKLKNDFENEIAYRLDLKHEYLSKNNLKKVYFDVSQESQGTNRFIKIFGEILNTIDNNGIIIIDELEVNLHPYLVNYINTYINSSNNKKSQIIYTSHCYNLLELKESKLRHDQIWFTQRKEDQSTDLFSLADFSERKDSNLNILKRYFEGRYGALPFIDKGKVD
jgi:AAA15 family ATPase/GTPase